MGDLVDDGDRHLLDEFALVGGDGAERQPVERDDVGHDEAAVVVPLGQRNTLVETEEVVGRMTILHHDRDVLHQSTECLGQCVERVGDEAFEGRTRDGIHAADASECIGPSR